MNLISKNRDKLQMKEYEKQVQAQRMTQSLENVTESIDSQSILDERPDLSESSDKENSSLSSN